MAVNEMFGAESDSFLALLHVAASEYPLVVLLRADQPKCFMSYEAPPLRDAENSVSHFPSRRTIRNALSPRRGFAMVYQSDIPRSVNSYHLTLKVPEQIRVRQLIMSTTVDESIVQSLARDIKEISRQFDVLKLDHPVVLEEELRAVASRLVALARRRSLDISTYMSAWSAGGTTGHGDQADISRTDPLGAMDTHPLCSLLTLADIVDGDEVPQLSTTVLTKERLESVARVLESSELGRDLTVNSDPRESGAHAYWRRATLGLGSRSTDPLQVRAFVALADDPPSLAGSVARMTLALFALVVGLGWNLAGGPREMLRSPGGQLQIVGGDALVAVLLLVPGLLLARLDIPGTASVLGHLRLLPRVLAYAAAATTTILAAAIAAEPGGNIPRWSFPVAALILLLLFVYNVLSLLAQRRTRQGDAARFRPMPRWMACELHSVDVATDRTPDGRFEVVKGGKHGGTP